MAFETVDVGSSPNDGTGTPLRTAWQKFNTNFAALAASTGAALVGFLQSGTGAVARSAQDKLRETTSDADYNTLAQAITAAGWIIYRSTNSLILTRNSSAAPPAQIDLPAGSDVLHLVGKDACDTGILLDTFGNSVNPRIYGRRARGTNAAKTAVQSGDNLLVVEVQGYDGEAYTADYDALLSFIADENWTAGGHGTKAKIEVVQPGTTTASTSAFFTYRGVEPYVNLDTAAGEYVRNVSTGTSAYAATYYGDADSETAGIVGLVCKNNTAYGGPKSMLVGTNTAKPLVLITNGLERVQVPQDSNGLRFPASAVPSTDLSTFDDYREATTTPTITFATPGDLSVEYTVQSLTYTKIGNRVLFDIFLICVPTFTTASGQMIIGGLPFTVANVANEYPFFSPGQFRNISKTGFQIGCFANIDTTSLYVVASDQAGGAQVNVEATNVTSGNQLVFCVSGHYKTTE